MAKPGPTAPFQFTLSTALWGVSAAAIVCAVTRWLGRFPTPSLPPATALVAACMLARRRKDPDLAWALFATAWCWALCDMGVRMTDCFTHPITLPLPPTSIGGMFGGLSDTYPCSGCPPQGYIGLCLAQTFWLAVALPLALSLPSAWLINQAARRSRSVARKWLILCPLLAIFNAGLLTAGMGLIVQFGGW
jgi:hypothetical protein